MKLFFSEIKKSVLVVIGITILLILQANADLSLPTYTANIVNVGIQQGGIESPVPDVIRKSQMDKIKMILGESNNIDLNSHFKLIDNKDYSQGEWDKLLKDYPLLKDEDLYMWDGENEEALKEYLALPMMMIFGAEQSGMEENPGPEAVNPEAVDSQAKLEEMKKEIEGIPESILEQSGIAFVKGEYEAIGLNVNKIQSKYIIKTGSKMLGLSLLVMAAAICVTFLASRVAASIGKSLRGQVFNKVISFSSPEMDKFSTASLITRSTNDIQQVQILTVMILRVVIYAPILAMGGIIKVFNSNVSMAWILGVGIGAILVVVIALFVLVMPKFKKMQKLVDKINLVMREILTGLPVIRAFSTEKHEKDRFDKANINFTKNSLFVNRAMTFMMPLMMLIMNLVAILIMWIGAEGVDIGTMQVGDIMAFIQYTMQIIMAFLMLTMVSIAIPRAIVSAKRINEVLKSEVLIHDPIEPVDLSKTNKDKIGVVEFEDVCFCYPEAPENVITGISFATKAGETTAIIGSTGSGKSTLINLIPRFYDVVQGSVKFRGIDVRDIKQKDLRDRIGYVPQKGVLFSGTIESNIKFSDKEAPDEVMKQAAETAQAMDFIEGKTIGFQDPISQGGSNVSGGQKQRLSIARALAKKPEVYIFDDSFSALDFKTDVALRRALEKETRNSAVIIVAQRISTIIDAEQILVLDEGKLVGKGTHKELLNNCEVYRQIAASQLSKEELENE